MGNVNSFECLQHAYYRCHGHLSADNIQIIFIYATFLYPRYFKLGLSLTNRDLD